MGGGRSDPEISGGAGAGAGAVSEFFSVLRTSVWSKNMGGGGGSPGPSLGTATV